MANQPKSEKEGYKPMTGPEAQALTVGSLACVIFGAGRTLQVVKVKVVAEQAVNTRVVQVEKFLKRGLFIPKKEQVKIGDKFVAMFGDFYHL